MTLKDSVTTLFTPERTPVLVGHLKLLGGSALAPEPGVVTRILDFEAEPSK